jgi:hypothetical protein
MLPNVTVNQVKGNLGISPASDDGIAGLIASGVAVAGQFALNDVMIFKSIDEVIAKGIDAAYDTTNTCMAYKHASDFFLETGKGSTLYMMIVAKSVKQSDMVDNTNVNTAKKMLLAGEGKIRLLACTWIPAGGYTPTYTEQFDADLWLAVANAKALRIAEYTAHKPVKIILEGRDFQGNATSARNLRDSTGAGLNANRVSIVIGNDNNVLTTYTWATKYAAVGLQLGREARIRVHQSIGRVRDGEVAGVVKAGISNGALLSTFADTAQDTLNDKGYIFLRSHTGIPGYFWNRDHTCAPITDDCAYSHDGRVIDKVTRIAYQIYVNEILNDVRVDPITGLLDVATCKHYEGLIKAEVKKQMADELVDIGAFVDPAQNVIQQDKITVEVNIIRLEVPGQIVVNLAFSRTL